MGGVEREWWDVVLSLISLTDVRCCCVLVCWRGVVVVVVGGVPLLTHNERAAL